jgi:hypothetical protein
MGPNSFAFFDPINLQVTALVSGGLALSGLFLHAVNNQKPPSHTPQIVPNILPLA